MCFALEIFAVQKLKPNGYTLANLYKHLFKVKELRIWHGSLVQRELSLM